MERNLAAINHLSTAMVAADEERPSDFWREVDTAIKILQAIPHQAITLIDGAKE